MAKIALKGQRREYRIQTTGIESRKRSLIKSLIWRVIATTVTMLVSYIWLGKWADAIVLALVANLIKSVLYYLHERAWDRTDFGRKKIKEDYMI